jgi:hypothetical protein
MIRRITVIAGLVLAPVAALAVAVSPAGAAVATPVPTAGCHAGVYAGYCGIQTNGNGRSLKVVDDSTKPGTLIRGLPDNRPDRGFDFYWFAYQGGTAKIAEYAPRGVASDECMTEIPHAVIPQTLRPRYLTLEPCTGNLDQQWTFNGYGWANGQTGDVITIAQDAAHLAIGQAPQAVPTKAETWSFSS